MRAPVRPGLRSDVALRHALEAVVADRRRRPQALFGIARLEESLLRAAMAPDPGEAVGLELEGDGELVALSLSDALAQGAHLLLDPEKVLDVMADLVSDHVGLREVPGAAHAVELVEEGKVEIDRAVERAVEGSRSGGPVAAAGLGRAREKNQARFLVALAV